MAKQTVKPIPEGHHTVTPYLIYKDAAKAIDFCKRAFGATELFRMPKPDGRLRPRRAANRRFRDHAGRRGAGNGARGPQSFGGTPVLMHLYVEDVDAVVARRPRRGGHALTAGHRPVLRRSLRRRYRSIRPRLVRRDPQGRLECGTASGTIRGNDEAKSGLKTYRTGRDRSVTEHLLIKLSKFYSS